MTVEALDWLPPNPGCSELLAHAKNRQGWGQLTQLQQERAEALLLAAESPQLRIITTDNHAFQKRLGWTSGQAQRMVSALKRARLLSVERRWETLPDGSRRERGPAAWIYTETDALRSSQIPKRRAKRTEARLRSLQSQVDVLYDEVALIRRELERVKAPRRKYGDLHNGGLSG
jgi:hypothetical protein